jgi:hypothetical protein
LEILNRANLNETSFLSDSILLNSNLNLNLELDLSKNNLNFISSDALVNYSNILKLKKSS